MSSIVILGASSFLGSSYLRLTNTNLNIKAVYRSNEPPSKFGREGVNYIRLVSFNGDDLQHVIKQGDIVINFIYIHGGTWGENKALLDNVIRICAAKRVLKLIHISTALVGKGLSAGKVSRRYFKNLQRDYEMIKFGLEQQLITVDESNFIVCILRPTAVVGEGGKNLVKLINQIKNGSSFVNFLRLFLLGNLPLHLVPVSNVVNAIDILCEVDTQHAEVFTISCDDDYNNTYAGVSRVIAKEVGRTQIWPPFYLPRCLVGVLMYISRRSPESVYSRFEISPQFATRIPADLRSISTPVSEFSRSVMK